MMNMSNSAHRERMREYMRRVRAEYPEELAAYYSAWCEQHRERKREINRQSYHRRKNNDTGNNHVAE